MRATFDIRSNELISLSKKFEKISKRVNDAAYEGLNKAAMRIGAQAQENLKKNDNIATGQLFNSLRIDRASGSNAIDVLFNSDHAANIELGQKSGTRVEPKTLVEWLKKKNFIPGKGRKGYLSHLWAVATVISRNILAKGTKARPFLYPAFRNNEQEVIDILQREINKVTR